jgi:hypothetical protein
MSEKNAFVEYQKQQDIEVELGKHHARLVVIYQNLAASAEELKGMAEASEVDGFYDTLLPTGRAISASLVRLNPIVHAARRAYLAARGKHDPPQQAQSWGWETPAGL